MPTFTTNSVPHANHRGDLTIAVLAFGSASAGIVLGGPPLWVALVALAWPLAAFLACNHLAGRGAVMVCVISALAAGMGTGGSSAWSAVGVLATIDLMALAGGLVAEHMAPVARVVAPPGLAAIPIVRRAAFVRAARPTQRSRVTRPAGVKHTA